LSCTTIRGQWEARPSHRYVLHPLLAAVEAVDRTSATTAIAASASSSSTRTSSTAIGMGSRWSPRRRPCRRHSNCRKGGKNARPDHRQGLLHRPRAANHAVVAAGSLALPPQINTERAVSRRRPQPPPSSPSLETPSSFFSRHRLCQNHHLYRGSCMATVSSIRTANRPFIISDRESAQGRTAVYLFTIYALARSVVSQSNFSRNFRRDPGCNSVVSMRLKSSLTMASWSPLLWHRNPLKE
jgi:hypothetical protein